MRPCHVVAALLLFSSCATAPPPPVVQPKVSCPDFDPAKIGDVAELDRENTENQAKVAALQRALAALQEKFSKIGAGVTAERNSPKETTASSTGFGDRVRVRLTNELLFHSGSARISRAGRSALVEVANVLKQSPPARIEVNGHTDSAPAGKSWNDNWQLSCERARGVVTFLISQGIEPRQLVASGHGDSDPIDAGNSDEARSKNRRVEIFVEPKAQ